MTYSEFLTKVSNHEFGNVLIYAANAERHFEYQAEMSGYQRISTFASDLAIADFYEMRGNKGSILDTFNNICNSWLNDSKMFTEFIIALNWKIWDFYEVNEEIAQIYNDLWIKAEEIFIEHYKDNEEVMEYYYRATD